MPHAFPSAVNVVKLALGGANATYKFTQTDFVCVYFSSASRP